MERFKWRAMVNDSLFPHLDAAVEPQAEALQAELRGGQMHALSSADTVIVTLIVCIAACAIVRRLVRAANIALHGWPPPHCDADGDIIKRADICEDPTR